MKTLKLQNCAQLWVIYKFFLKSEDLRPQTLWKNDWKNCQDAKRTTVPHFCKPGRPRPTFFSFGVERKPYTSERRRLEFADECDGMDLIKSECQFMGLKSRYEKRIVYL